MLKFSVNSLEFAETVDKVANAVTVTKDKGEVIESCIQIRVFRDMPFKDGKLGVMLAFDTKKQLLSSFQANDVQTEDKDGEFYVSGKKLKEVANAFAVTDTVLNITVESEFKIEGAGSVLKLPLGNKITFIQAEKEMVQEIEMETKELQQLLRYGGCAYDFKSTKNLDCICLQFSKKDHKAVAISSDTLRIAYAETKELTFSDKTTQEDRTVLIDVDQLKALGKLMNTKNVLIRISEKQLYVKCGTDVAIFLTKEGSFPISSISNVKDSMKIHTTLKVLNQDMLNALVIFEIGHAGPEAYLEVVSINDKQICFKSVENTAETNITVAQNGVFKKMGLNEKLFKQVLSVFSRDKALYISIGDENMPIQVREEEDAANVIMLCVVNRDKKDKK